MESQNVIYDLAIIGAGSAGLSVAAAAAQFGERVVLFEKAEMGGDCLNVGCVPSKALIAAAKYADIIAVRGDVLRHIDLLSRIDVVIKHGKLYK